MKKQLSYLLVITMVITLFSCSKDDAEIVQEPAKSSAKKIISFVFKASENDALTEDVTAIINEQSKTINLAVPNGTTITSLNPTVQFSEKATVGQIGAKDFSSPIDYTITAEDGTTAVYKTMVAIAPNSAKQLLSFTFKTEDNELYGDETITATIDEVNKTITATISYSANAALLLPSIEISPDATISPENAQDFSNPVVYTVTAEDGSTSTYQVQIETTFTDRDVLIAIYNTNPNNTIGWDLQDKDISNWLGVTLDGDDNVDALYIGNLGLDILPPEIDQLSNLELLALDGNALSSLPSEIVKLKNLVQLSIGGNQLNLIPSAIYDLSNLRYLYLNNNRLTEIPKEIGKLSNLQYLEVDGNQLTTIPATISQLSNLERINLGFNKLTSIPPEIGQLKNLQYLSIFNNQLTTLPKEIGGLTSLTFLVLSYNELTSIPLELGNLTSLTGLYLNENILSSIPQEIGNLTSLTSLNLTTNLLTSIPQEVCKLEVTGTEIRLDPDVTCE